MNEAVLRFRVGVVVLAALAILLFLFVIFGSQPQFLQRQYSIRVRFPSAPGVAKNAAVRKNGVTIGRVTDIQLLDDEKGGGVVLTLAIDEGRKLRLNELCRIGTSSLVTGDAVLEFVPDEKSFNTSLIQPNDYLPDHGIVAGDPFQVIVNAEDKLSNAFVAIEGAATKISSLLVKAEDKLDTVLSDEEQITRILKNTETALENFAKTMDSIQKFVDDPQLRGQLKDTLGGLAEAIQDLPALFDDAQGTLEEVNQAVASFRRVGESAEANMKNIEKLTEPLGERSGELIDEVERSLKSLGTVLEQVAELTETVNQGEGTIGRLVKDDTLYEEVLQITENVNQISHRIRPIIEDVRVLTDKLARDPGVLARGILGNRGGGLKTGVKTVCIDGCTGCAECLDVGEHARRIVERARADAREGVRDAEFTSPGDRFSASPETAAFPWRPTRVNPPPAQMRSQVAPTAAGPRPVGQRQVAPAESPSPERVSPARASRDSALAAGGGSGGAAVRRHSLPPGERRAERPSETRGPLTTWAQGVAARVRRATGGAVPPGSFRELPADTRPQPGAAPQPGARRVELPRREFPRAAGPRFRGEQPRGLRPEREARPLAQTTVPATAPESLPPSLGRSAPAPMLPDSPSPATQTPVTRMATATRQPQPAEPPAGTLQQPGGDDDGFYGAGEAVEAEVALAAPALRE